MCVLALTGTMMLTACGNKKDSNNGKTSDGKTAIRFATWDVADDVDAQQKLVDKFNEEHDDIEVTLEAYGSDFDTKISAGMGSGDTPDVMYMWNYPAYADGLEPLDEYIDKEGDDYKNDFYSTLWNYNSLDGTTYGIPVGFTTHSLFYNKDLFAQAGVEEPTDDWTWSDLQAAAKTIEEKTGFDEATCIGVAKQVKQIVDQGIQVAIVTGGGNFWRGRTSETIDRTKADQIGMLATVMNCIYVSDIFRHVGMKTEVFTPFVCGAFTSLFSKDAAVEALNEGKVIFFAGGTGHPYFSTDTGAVLRAIEIEADAMLLAKAIDGIYDSDPKVNPEAKKYDEISIQEIIDKKLMAVDLTASIMCLENKMPMLVFGLNEENSIVETMSGNFNGTKVTV